MIQYLQVLQIHKWSLPGAYIVNITAVDENNASSGITTLKVKIVDESDEKPYFFVWWLLLLAILIAGPGEVSNK